MMQASSMSSSPLESPSRPPDLRQWLLCILWPSFLMAGVTEMLVFAVVDPGDLTWFGGAAIDWPRQAIYTVSFFIFWAVTAVACGLTALLSLGAPDVNRARRRL